MLCRSARSSNEQRVDDIACCSIGGAGGGKHAVCYRRSGSHKRVDAREFIGRAQALRFLCSLLGRGSGSSSRSGSSILPLVVIVLQLLQRVHRFLVQQPCPGRRRHRRRRRCDARCMQRLQQPSIFRLHRGVGGLLLPLREAAHAVRPLVWWGHVMVQELMVEMGRPVYLTLHTTGSGSSLG